MLSSNGFPSKCFGYYMTKFLRIIKCVYLSAILRLTAKMMILTAKTMPMRDSGESLKRHLVAYR
jgi:hypothetical protein